MNIWGHRKKKDDHLFTWQQFASGKYFRSSFFFSTLVPWFQISKECFLLGDVWEFNKDMNRRKIRTNLPCVFFSLAFTWIIFFVVIFIYKGGDSLLALGLLLSSHSLSLISSFFFQDPSSPMLNSACSCLKLQQPSSQCSMYFLLILMSVKSELFCFIALKWPKKSNLLMY